MTLRRLAMIAGIVWLSGFLPRGAASADERVRIAVLPVVVHSSESRAYLRDGIADMLSSRLEQVRELDVIRVKDPSLATNRVSVALEEGRRLGADYVLFGSFTRFGEGASLDMQCLAVVADEGGEAVRKIFVHSGNIGNVIPDLDDLAGKVSRFTVEDFDRRASAVAPSPNAPARESLADLRERVHAMEEALRTHGISLPGTVPPAADEGLGATGADTETDGPSSSNRELRSAEPGPVAAR